MGAALPCQQAADTDQKGTVLSRLGQACVTFGTTRPGIYRLMFASPILREPAAAEELKTVARDSFLLLENALLTARTALPTLASVEGDPRTAKCKG